MALTDGVAAYVANFQYVAGETPLSSLPALVAGLVSYLIVFPLLAWTYGVVSRKETNPDKLALAKAQRSFYRPLMLLHNAFLSVGSLVMMVGLVSGYVEQYRLEAGAGAVFFRGVCDPGQVLFGRLQFWIYAFYLSKYYEFLDTVFLCVTMRQVIPLHWIHHVLTLIVAWIGLETKHTVMGVACVMNTAIHVVMYGYYAVKLVYPKYEPWWKKSLTKLQMRQFVVNVVGLGLWTYLHLTTAEGDVKCTGEMWVILVVLGVMVIFLGMFAAFAKKTYSGSGREKAAASKTK
jgi:hypothetical protein